MKRTKIVAISLVCALVFSIVMPIASVFAATSYTITFTAEDGHTIENEGGHLKIDGQFVDLRDSNDNNVNIGEVSVTSQTVGSITVTNGVAGKLNYNSANSFTLFNTAGHVEYVMDTTLDSDTVFMVEDFVGNNNPTQPSGNDPTIVPSADYEDINVNFSFTGTTGEVIVNDIRAGEETDSWSGVVKKSGFTDSDKKNNITITTSFGSPKFSKITINGVDYTFTDNGDTHVIEVPGASSYTITATADESIEQDRTVIWTNPDYVPLDEEDAKWASQFSIGHGYAKVIEVYDENGILLNPSVYTKEDEDEFGLKDGFGWISVMPGDKAVFEFTPEYGYQLTEITINGMPLNATSTMNRFEFTVKAGSGNIQFGAKFTKTEDIVKTESDKVSSGSIKLGNTLNGGTAQLSVSDVTLSSDKIKGFENAAGDYTISNYINIDLYNVFYKGKEDSNDVWSNKISELGNDATISLKLADGITADDIVIVHNIHDGEEYEVIEIESYDAETNTITFKTKSFSNYAIASKTTSVKEENEDESTNPQTSDNIKTTLGISLIALLGVALTFKLKNKNM